MPLVPPVTPAEVEALGALVPQLFRLDDQPSLDAVVQTAIDYASSWMEGHMGGNFGLAQFPWQVTLQRRGCMYLALESLTNTLKAEKTYGSSYALASEDTPAYEKMVETAWGVLAREALDLWLTVEQIGVGFAAPYFGVTQTTPTNTATSGGLDPLAAIYEDELSYARGITPVDPGTVRP